MATYYEMIIRGDDRDMVPYLTGFMAAGDLKNVYIATESGFHLKSLRERVKHHGEVQHVICEGDQRSRLRSAVEKAPDRYGFKVEEEARIERAYFPFEFDTPSREVAAAIKKVLAALPTGVKATDYIPEEIEDPDAKGAEVYSPAHEYEFRGKGVIEGDPGGVIRARQALGEIEFAKVHEIEIHRA
jgi:hypothetical protein